MNFKHYSKHIFQTCFGIFIVLQLQSSAFGIDEPLRATSGLANPRPENVQRVRSARVMLADYALLKRDFPVLRFMNEAEIDLWLLDQTGFISEPQAAQTVTNTHIEVTGETRRALRPYQYGRALVYEVENGLIDVKGAGAGVRPSQMSHRNGLASLGEAVREFIYEKHVETVLAHAGSEVRTVGSYAVIDWGFEVIPQQGPSNPAGAILRQAHTRSPTQQSVLGARKARVIENILREYGITSAGAYFETFPYDKVNIQATRDGRAIMDFGGYMAMDEFRARRAQSFHSGETVYRAGRSPQPRAQVRVPLNQWGTTVSGILDPTMDNPWIWSHELANDFSAGRASREAARIHVENMVGTYRRQLLANAGRRLSVMQRLVRALKYIR